MIFMSLWSRFNSLAEFGPEETHGVELARLYEENYVVITPADKIPPGTSTLRWADAARLPLAPLTPEMRVRQIIDSTFASIGTTVSPKLRPTR